jgi:hypothetical protein
MRSKHLNGRRNLQARRRVARATLLKRFHRHGFPRQTARGEAAKGRRLPSVRRNVSGFCRKTSRVRAAFARRLTTRLKRLNRRRFSSRSDRAITISPQAAQRRLAKKTRLSERFFVLSRTP